MTTEHSKLIWIDEVGRHWSTRFTIPDAVALRDRYDVKDSKRIDAALADPEQLLDFAVEYFRPQWSKHVDVIDNDVAFMAILTATETSLIEAHAAIVAGLLDFFRRCGDVKRAATLERAVAAQQKATEFILAKIHSTAVDDAFGRELTKAGAAFDEAIANPNFGKPYSNGSASSDSDPLSA